MADVPPEVPAEKDGAWSSGFSKEYEVPQSKTKAFMVEDAQWERIRKRVSVLEAKGGIDWLIAGATMVAGIGASAGLALLALPKATKDQAELSPFVRPVLWVTLVGGLFLAAVLGMLWVHFKDDEQDTASDICEEMNTIQEAWKEREDTEPSKPAAAG